MRSESVQQEWEESGEGVRSHRRQLGFCICELSWSTGSSLYSKESRLRPNLSFNRHVLES